jgi:hypothetical protein
MEISQKYLHDRIVLLLLTINGFLVILSIVLIFLKLSSGQGGNYIIQYRPNLGISAYTTGKQSDFLSFILFGLVTFGIGVALSARIFGRHRSYALAILGFGTLIGVLTVIVSNALLVLS